MFDIDSLPRRFDDERSASLGAFIDHQGGTMAPYQRAKEADMIATETDHVTAFDRALAGWEVGPLNGMLGIVHLPVSAIMLTGSLAVTFFGNRTAALALLVGFAIWLAFAVADVSRSMWIRMRPFASRRWLNAVREAVSDEVFDDAIDRLRTGFGHDPAYVIRRADLALEIRVVRAIVREDRQRADGIGLAAKHAQSTT